MVGYQFMEHLAVEGGYGQTEHDPRHPDVPGSPAGTQDEVDFVSEIDQI